MNNEMIQRRIIQAALTALTMTAQAQQRMSLAELYDLADRQSVQIGISKTSLQAAGEAVAAARSAMLPSVGFSLEGSYVGDVTLMTRGFSTSGTTDVIVAGLGPQAVPNGRQETPHWNNTFAAQASQVVYAGGAITAGIRMAELGQQLAELDVEKNRQEVRFVLTGYYLDLAKLQGQREVIDRNIALTRRLIQNMQARHEQGTVLRSDITRHELQVKSLELARVKLNEAEAIICHQLATMLHLAEGTTIAPDTLGMMPQEVVSALTSHEQWQRTAADSNLQLRQAALATAMATQRIKSTRAASLPSVAVVAEERLFGPYTNDLIPTDANINTWFIGVGVKYSLSSLWKNRHHVSKARLDATLQQEQEVLLREQVGNRVQAHYQQLLTAQEEVSTQQKQVQLAAECYDVVLNRYEQGLALLTDMLDASSTKLAAETALVNARIALLYSYYQLRYAASTL